MQVTTRNEATEDQDSGFTLIELLVVMIIIGILAAIAVPAFLNQKKKAKETAAKSDATNVSKEVAAALVDGNPAAITLSDTGLLSITQVAGGSAETVQTRLSSGNRSSIAYAAATGVYCVTVAPVTAGDYSAWSAGGRGLMKGLSCP